MIISIAPPINEEKLKSYTDWVERHGLDWKVLTEEDSEIIGGLLLCGGADVGTRPIRDKFEKELIDQALFKDLPILGICRGMQIVNAHLGGVVEDIEDEGGHCPHPEVAGDLHADRLRSLYHEVYSQTDDIEFMVNSRHHQQCSILASKLTDVLYSSWDNIIEAASGDKILLVQWHPERKEMWNNKEASDWPMNWIKKYIQT